MSFVKEDRLLPTAKTAVFERKLAEEIARILRLEYKGVSSPVKKISLRTGIAGGTIKKWYSGKNPPRMAHILMLARYYPAMLLLLLRLSGHDYLCPHVLPSEQVDGGLMMATAPAVNFGKNVPRNVPLKSWPEDINERQLWFLIELSRKALVTADDIVNRWRVTEKTARRDIAHLKTCNLVVYVGAKKAGRYEYKGE